MTFTLGLARTSGLLTGTPVAPGRDTGQAWARSELAHPAYARARPSWIIRLIQWGLRQLDKAASATGLGAGQLAALLLVIALVVVVVLVLLRRRVRLSVAGASGPGAVLGATNLTGADHRRRAEQAASAGQYADAVREWMRAIARRLDERALLDPRPGRTADELAREAGAVLPMLAADLARGARTFDDVVYGSVTARADQADELRRLDAAVEATRPALPGAMSPALSSAMSGSRS